MTAPHIVDPAGLLDEALGEASPDLMRSLLQSIINALLCADADAVVGAEWGPSLAGPDQSAQRLPASRPGHPGRDHRRREPQAPQGQLLPCGSSSAASAPSPR
jgi:hypothetical protein